MLKLYSRMSVLWLESWCTRKYSLSPQAIFHHISPFLTRYIFNKGNSNIYTYKITYFWFFLHFLDSAFDSHFRILKLQSQQKNILWSPDHWSRQLWSPTTQSIHTWLFHGTKFAPKAAWIKLCGVITFCMAFFQCFTLSQSWHPTSRWTFFLVPWYAYFAEPNCNSLHYSKKAVVQQNITFGKEKNLYLNLKS